MRPILIFLFITSLLGCKDNELTLENSLIYCSEKMPASFNPQINHDAATIDATTHQLYNRLITFDIKQEQFIPSLATHWKKNKQEQSITFFLRKDVPFHQTSYFTPTRNFNADDVIFSFNRMIKKRHPYHLININNSNRLFSHPFNNLIKKMVKIDDFTLKFILTAPLENDNKNSLFMENLSLYYSVILSKEYADNLLAIAKPDQIDNLPIGTGPYQFLNSDSFHLFRFQAHKNYWGTPAPVENLIFDVTPSSIKRYAKLLANQCDIIAHPAPSQVSSISKQYLLKLNLQSTDNISMLAFNTQRAPLNNQRIRKILAHTIQKDQIIKSIYFTTPLSHTKLIKQQSWVPYFNEQHNEKRAIEELATLNISKNNPLIILTLNSPSDYNANPNKTGRLLQARLKVLGIKSNVVSLPLTVLNQKLSKGDYDIFVTGHQGHSKDPSNLFTQLLSCQSSAVNGNSANWCNPDTQKLLNKMQTSKSAQSKEAVYKELKKELLDGAYYLPITLVSNFYVTHDNIRGVRSHPISGIDFTRTTKKVGN